MGIGIRQVKLLLVYQYLNLDRNFVDIAIGMITKLYLQ